MTRTDPPAVPAPQPGDATRDHPAVEQAALKDALAQSQGVQQKVVAVADALGANNEQVRGLMSGGTEVLPASESLAHNEQVESDVKEVADDLDRVNGALTQGVEDLAVIGQALSESHSTQRDTNAKLLETERERDIAQDRALHDVGTGLPNRALFADRLVHAISMADRHAWTLAVMFIDLDRFKDVNDTLGHAAGDVVLKEVARRLSRHSRDEDTVCRYGGDEFLLLLVNPQGADNVERIAQAVTDSIAEPIDIGSSTTSIGCSIGIAYYPADGSSGRELIEVADAAMYAVKRRATR